MKNKIANLIAALLIILAVAYFIRYDLASDHNYRIPKNAVAVVHLNLRHIEKHLLGDFLSNPGEYLKKKSSKKKTNKKTFDIKSDVHFPKDFVLYSLGNDYISWMSQKVPIENLKLLPEYLLSREFKAQKLPKKQVFSKKNLHLIIEDAGIKFFITSHKLQEELPKYFQKFETADKNGSLMTNLNKSKADASLITSNGTVVNADFTNGAIRFSGYLNKNFFWKTNALQKENNLLVCSTTLNINNPFISKLLDKINAQKFRKITKLDYEFFRQHWDGKFQLAIKDFKLQKDTIKTYQYDDDFNKIEKIAIQDNIIPDFSMQLGIKSSFKGYFEDMGAIKKVGQDTLFVAFPLAKTYASFSTDNMFLYTTNLAKEQSEKIKLQFFFDVARYHKTSKKTIYDVYINLDDINAISLLIDAENNIEGHIKYNNNRNVLAKQLLWFVD